MQPRRLVLVRHARAADAAVDAERPLTGRGAERAAAIGAWLDRSGLGPDRVLVSPARRAVQTWERASAQLPQSPPPTVDDRIYDNTVEALLAAVQETPDDTGTLVLVGHNPSLGELAMALDDGQGDPTLRRELHAGVPTGAVVVFDLATTFAGIAPGAATLSDFAVPD